MWIISEIYKTFITRPLKQLFLYGPTVYSVGFWGGKRESEICREVTGHSQLFWEMNASECTELVESRFQAFKITWEVMVYFFFLYKSVDKIFDFVKNFHGPGCKRRGRKRRRAPVMYWPAEVKKIKRTDEEEEEG
jgi:hypothetical protein